MKRITTNLAVWLLLGGIGSFAILNAVFTHPWVVEISNGLLMGTYFLIALTTFMTAYDSVKRGARENWQLLNFSLFLVFAFLLIRSGWTLTYRINGRPIEMINHWSNPFTTFSVFWAALIVLLAPNTHGGVIYSTTNQFYTLIAFFTGGIIAGVSIALSLGISL